MGTASGSAGTPVTLHAGVHTTSGTMSDGILSATTATTAIAQTMTGLYLKVPVPDDGSAELFASLDACIEFIGVSGVS